MLQNRTKLFKKLLADAKPGDIIYLPTGRYGPGVRYRKRKPSIKFKEEGSALPRSSKLAQVLHDKKDDSEEW